MISGNSRGEFPIDRKTYSEIFHEFLEKCDFDSYGYNGFYKEEIYDDAVFRIRPYYWGDAMDIMELPNFVYKPLGLTINWYKYPLRDSYSNIELDEVDFESILEHCIENYIKERLDEV